MYTGTYFTGLTPLSYIINSIISQTLSIAIPIDFSLFLNGYLHTHTPTPYLN